MQGKLLTNAEVYELLNEQKLHRTERGICDPAVEYFHSTVTYHIDSNVDKTLSSPENIVSINKMLEEEELGLTEAETMQLLNVCPSFPVEVHLVSMASITAC